MLKKLCAHCGKSFLPRPQTPDQSYCSDPQCQKARRKRWVDEKRKVGLHFSGITNPELKRHGWSVTQTIGANTVKRILTTLSATGPGNAHRFPHQNSLMGSIAFAQSARSPLQRATRGLLKLCIRHLYRQTEQLFQFGLTQAIDFVINLSPAGVHSSVARSE
jgi:endogenous inhibitor of DNA gyrase (YacG/DUF329 family)